MTCFLAAGELVDANNDPLRPIDLAILADDDKHARRLAHDFIRANDLRVLRPLVITTYEHDITVFNFTPDQPIDWLGR